MPAFHVVPWEADLYPALYRDLALHPQQVQEWFPLAPDSPEAWKRRAEETIGRWVRQPQLRQALCDELEDYHDRLGCTARQAENLRRLRQDETLVVVTGQQAGLLTGPLYTVLKALGAVRRAQQASALLGVPVVPVFWVASEDHDVTEVCSVALPTADGRLASFSLPLRVDGRSAGHIPVPTAAARILALVEQTVQPLHPEAQSILADLRRQLGSGPGSLADWFVRQMQALLGPYGLLLYDPMRPRLRELAVPVLERACELAESVQRAVEEAGAALRARGYSPGLAPEPGQTHVFMYREGRRSALYLRDGRLCTRDGSEVGSAQELGALVRRSPTAFSPDVVLRPVVQEWMLPVLAQLGGPGEVAYLAQLEGVFRLWGLRRPLIAPRPGATIVLPEDAEALSAVGAGPQELRQGVTRLLDRWLETSAGPPLADVFSVARQRLEALYGELDGQLQPWLSTMRPLLAQNRERVLYQLEYLEHKARQHRRRLHRGVARRLRAAQERLFPGGGLQERRANIYGFLLREGPCFLQQLVEAVPTEGTHAFLFWQR